jgi:perosamine synthetase
MENIPVAGPWITEKEIAYVTDAVTNAWYSNANMYHQRFEKAFAEYIGVQYAMHCLHAHQPFIFPCLRWVSAR